MTKPLHTQGTAATDGWQIIVGSVRIARVDSPASNAGLGDFEDLANADRMVLVWNAHDGLVAALQAARNGIQWFMDEHGSDESDHEMLQQIDAALKKAGAA